MTKALVMFSGWLDSLLSIHILKNQWIDVTAITYTTPFFSSKTAEIYSKQYWIKLRVINIDDKHFEIVKNPENWYWKNMNPCIDCHGFMFSTAAKIANEEWFDIIASWEVLGQRPMSQNANSLAKVEKIAWKDVLRPMSAKLMEETSYEKEWLVDREKLMDISWRSRKRQMELAEEFWLPDYKSAWWGCLLTTIEYSKKLKELINLNKEKVKAIDAEIIKHWRIKIIENNWNKFFLTMWRIKEDNEKLSEIFENLDENYYMFSLSDFAGPRLLLITFWEKINDELIKEITLWIQSRIKTAKEEKKLNLKILNWKEEEIREIILD